MDELLERSPLERFCAVLAEHGVEFIVIGGQAEVLRGSARVTYDVDLCYRRTPDNLERLAAALGTLSLTLRGAPPELKSRLDAQALALGQNYTFEVDGEYCRRASRSDWKHRFARRCGRWRRRGRAREKAARRAARAPPGRRRRARYSREARPMEC